MTDPHHHGHGDGLGHVRPRPGAAPAASLLRASATMRLGVVGVAIVAIWGGVLWAMS